MKLPITQSIAWQKLQDDLGEISHFEKQDDYQYLTIEKHTQAGNYLFVPYGPIADTKEGFKKALESLTELAKTTSAIFIRIEPTRLLEAEYLPHTAKKVHDIDPADTWILDITPDVPTILTNFSQGTRTRYNTYAKKGLTVESTNDPNDIKYLVALQNQLYKQKNLSAFSEKYLKTELQQPFATLYLVKYKRELDQTPSQPDGNHKKPKDGQVLAASLFFDFDDTRYYMQSAADGTYKKLPATVALLTKAIFDAKEQGIKSFDFWGIAPDDAPADHPWKGFTEFKKSFGGEARHYAGTYDLILNPARYKLFNLLKKLNKLIK